MAGGKASIGGTLPARWRFWLMQVIKQVKKESWLAKVLPARDDFSAMQVVNQVYEGPWLIKMLPA